jgi:hypothetical protein
MLPELAAGGASLVSLNPVRDSLEDFFIQRVAEVGEGARPASAPAGPASAPAGPGTPGGNGGRPDARH